MAKKKLVHFQENLTFPHLFQPDFTELSNGFRLRGNWHEKFFSNTHPIVVELGCGKGEYTVGLAGMHPETNFVGIDWKGARLWRGCKTIEQTGIKNAGFVRAQIDHIERIFAPGEVTEIWITFPDPFPGKERRRLTAPVFLKKYANVLTNNGIVHLKTDDIFFFRYTLDVIRHDDHHLITATDDLYHSGITDDALSIRTYYEKIWLEKEKKICYLKFKL